MSLQPLEPPPLAIVLGCSEAGSAVAHALHRDGLSVVLVDDADPGWHRRGRTFTNAWYIGNAELDGEGACFCASVRSIPSVLARRLIAATTWSWPGVAAALPPAVLVDARGRRRRGSETLVGRAPLAVGIGRGFVEGKTVDVAIALPSALEAGGGDEEPGAGSPTETGTPVCRGRMVIAGRPGRFMTDRRIGDGVQSAQVVGALGNEVVRAPASGVLLGLVARGARVAQGDPLVEVDPAAVVHRCYGIDEEARRVAAGVVATIKRRGIRPDGAGSLGSTLRATIAII